MNDIPTIDLRAELLDRHAGAIKGLYRLSTQIPIEKWALVGGLMVLVIAYEHDTHSWRASQTKDADIVVDVVADFGRAQCHYPNPPSAGLHPRRFRRFRDRRQPLHVLVLQIPNRRAVPQ